VYRTTLVSTNDFGVIKLVAVEMPFVNRAESIEYAHVFDHKGSLYMLYNGNSYGKTGIGLAILAGK